MYAREGQRVGDGGGKGGGMERVKGKSREGKVRRRSRGKKGRWGVGNREGEGEEALQSGKREKDRVKGTSGEERDGGRRD